MLLDEILELFDLMSGRYEKSFWMCADSFVVGPVDRDHIAALTRAAFANDGESLALR